MEDVKNVTDRWWLVLIQGILLILFGLFALFYPGISLAVLTIAFALFILIDGAINIIDSFITRKENSMWVLQLIFGILEVVAGIFALNYPGMSVLVITILIAISFIVRGIFALIAGFDKANQHKALTIIMAIMAILVGIIIFMHPIKGGIAWMWVIGAFALIAGPLTIVAAFEVRSVGKKLDKADASLAEA